MFVRLFRIKANESLEKFLAGAIYKEEKWWNWDKRALDHLRMPKLQEIFTTVAIVCYRYERLAVLQNVFAIILVWDRKNVEKRFEKTVYKKDKEKAEEAETKSSAWDLKNA